jgi:hypothetical protein
MNPIQVSDLRTLAKTLLDWVESVHGQSVAIPYNDYNDVVAHRYDTDAVTLNDVAPRSLELQDWKYLKEILDGARPPETHSLVYLAGVLRAIGDM